MPRELTQKSNLRSQSASNRTVHVCQWCRDAHAKVSNGSQQVLDFSCDNSEQCRKAVDEREVACKRCLKANYLCVPALIPDERGNRRAVANKTTIPHSFTLAGGLGATPPSVAVNNSQTLAASTHLVTLGSDRVPAQFTQRLFARGLDFRSANFDEYNGCRDSGHHQHHQPVQYLTNTLSHVSGVAVYLLLLFKSTAIFLADSIVECLALLADDPNRRPTHHRICTTVVYSGSRIPTISTCSSLASASD